MDKGEVIFGYWKAAVTGVTEIPNTLKEKQEQKLISIMFILENNIQSKKKSVIM